MKELIDLVMEYQKNKDETILQKIFKMVQPMTWKYRYKIDISYEDDFEQELNLRTYKTIERFNVHLQTKTKEQNHYELIKLLEMNYKYAVKDFYLQYQQEKKNELCFTNIDDFPYMGNQTNLDLEKVLKERHLIESEIQFLMAFIEDGRMLRQTEVAEKLHISQQKVSRLWNNIKRKYKTPYKEP